jgi:hypothetical protein
MKKLVCIALLVSACAHTAITKLSDCEQVQGEKRIECGACVAPNKADGWLGTYEYRPDDPEGKRCTRTK